MTQAPQAILDLVERFSRNIDQYRSSSYNEAQARREFIDSFVQGAGVRAARADG